MQSFVPSVILVVLLVPAILLLCALLFISPLMIWLNIRKLRIDLHADLQSIRDCLRQEPTAPAPAAEPEVMPPAPPEVEPAEGAEAGSENIGFSCPECGKFFEGPKTLAGTTYTCPECHTPFHIH